MKEREVRRYLEYLGLEPTHPPERTVVRTPSSKADESRRQAGEHECLDDSAEIDSPNCLALSSDSEGDAKLLPVSGQYGSEASVGGRDMAQKSLLQMLEDLASKVRSLERKNGEAAAKMEALELEKREAVVRAQALEREVAELAKLIALASEKVDEILMVGPNHEVSQPQAVNAPATSTSPGQLGEFSADPKKEPKERSSKAWRFD